MNQPQTKLSTTKNSSLEKVWRKFFKKIQFPDFLHHKQLDYTKYATSITAISYSTMSGQDGTDEP